jgi:hypothetical protein
MIISTLMPFVSEKSERELPLGMAIPFRWKITLQNPQLEKFDGETIPVIAHFHNLFAAETLPSSLRLNPVKTKILTRRQSRFVQLA